MRDPNHTASTSFATLSGRAAAALPMPSSATAPTSTVLEPRSTAYLCPAHYHLRSAPAAGRAADEEPEDGHAEELLCRGVGGDGDQLSGVRQQFVSNFNSRRPIPLLDLQFASSPLEIGLD
jgi:hypothetical protein